MACFVTGKRASARHSNESTPQKCIIFVRSSSMMARSVFHETDV